MQLKRLLLSILYCVPQALIPATTPAVLPRDIRGMGPIFGLLKPALPIAMPAAAHPLSFCLFLIERAVPEGGILIYLCNITDLTDCTDFTYFAF